MKNVFAIFMMLGSVLFFFSCSKKDEQLAKAHLTMSLTDDPASYDAVFIDVQGVELTGDNGNAFDINVNPGIYNLLALSNGIDTIIATGDIDAGTIQQIRLILGDNNSVVVDGVSYPLATPSAQESGLKLQVHETFEAGVSYAMLLDFDAGKSIVQEGNGDYKLKPVINVIDFAVSGSIKGIVLPVEANVYLQAISGNDTISTYANDNGAFLIQGVPAGTYSVHIIPVLPFLEISIDNVNVSVGNVTDIGTITF